MQPGGPHTSPVSRLFFWEVYDPPLSRNFFVHSGDTAYFLLIALVYFLIIILITKFFIGQYEKALNHSRLYSRRLRQEIAEHKRAREKVGINYQ